MDVDQFNSFAFINSTFSHCFAFLHLYPGIGVHWYMDTWVPASFLDKVHAAFPDVFILSTEACNIGGVFLGSWDYGEQYGHFIMEVI